MKKIKLIIWYIILHMKKLFAIKNILCIDLFSGILVEVL